MHRVAVYGTLRLEESRGGFMSGKNFRGLAKLPPNLHLFDLGAFPCVTEMPEPAPNPVVIEVYDVDDDTLSALDRIEGHPSFYERKLVPVEGHGVCWVYTLERMGAPRIKSGDWYDRDRA